MQIRSFKPSVGRIKSTNYTDKEKDDYEAKKVLYEELSQTYYLDTFSSKFITKMYLDELKAGRLWAPKKKDIVPYLTMLHNKYWSLSYNLRLDVEIPRFEKLLQLRREWPLTYFGHKHDPSERWF